VPTADVEDVPQVDDDRRPDGQERKEADHLARDGEREEDARENKPGPPGTRELAVSNERDVSFRASAEEGLDPLHARVTELVEADVGVKRERHEEDELRVEEDEAGLGDVGVVCRGSARSASACPSHAQHSSHAPKSTRKALKSPTILG